MVVATIDGKVVSWQNNWLGGAPTKAPIPVATPPPASPPASPPPASPPASHPAGDLAAAGKSPPTKPGPSGGDWGRVAYYNAEKQVAENMVFMGNYGGQGSGVWDTYVLFRV